MKNFIYLSLSLLLFPTLSFSSKAVCTVKNIQTGQIYKMTVGRQSYNVARKESLIRAYSLCSYNSKYANNCKEKVCYQR